MNSLVMLTPLVRGPYFENHCSKNAGFASLRQRKRAASWDLQSLQALVSGRFFLCTSEEQPRRRGGPRPRLRLLTEVRGSRYLFGLGGRRRRRGHRLHGSGRHDCDAQGCQSASLTVSGAASKQLPARTIQQARKMAATERLVAQEERLTHFRDRPFFVMQLPVSFLALPARDAVAMAAVEALG